MEPPQHNQKSKKKKIESAENGSKALIKEVGSVEEGKNMFQWIIGGISVDNFMK